LDEFHAILQKYDSNIISSKLGTIEEINELSTVFYRDVAEIYDCLTRIKNVERNPSGYSLDDAPVMGLLVKIWKLMKEIVSYYEAGNAEIISVLERPLLESAITASYLLKSNTVTIEDYRKVSYKDRLRILDEHDSGHPFFKSKAGQRLYNSVLEKLNIEGFDRGSFNEQKKNRWKLQGKNFFEIFKEVEDPRIYTYTFGMMSESIHASWNDSLDWCLSRNDDGTYDPYPFYNPPDIRYMTTTLTFCNKPYKLWLSHIGISGFPLDILDWIDSVNSILYVNYDRLYGNDHG
jgi:hypothetical protein